MLRARSMRLVTTLIIAVLALCCVSTAIAAEYRAFWVDAWGAGVLNQSQVDKLLGVVGNASSLGDIRNANCNAVFVQVRRNCDANYPSSMGEPYMSGLSPANFNSLQAVINAAHDTTGGKKRVEVHAWLVTFRTSGGSVYAQHSDPPTGSLTNLDNYWPSRTASGAEASDKAFDPGHPLAEEYTVNVAMDLVNNFNIDGVHFDYIRFTAGDQGYNPTSIARYNARYGTTGQPSSTDDRFDQWRRDQITSVVRKVYAKVQASKPQVKVSGSFVTWNPSPTASTRAAFMATRPYGNRTDGVFCDWDSWLQEGIVDMAVPMTYYDYASLPADWTRWMNFIKDRKFNRQTVVGPGIYLNSLSNAILEIQQTRNASPAGNYCAGFCGYSYRVPYASGTWAGFAPQLLSQVTSTWDDIPSMPWKTSPTKGHISGTVTDAETAKWVDGATVSIGGPENRTMLTDGTGFYAFIDLAPGVYTVTTSMAGYPTDVRTVTVSLGSVTGNMYVTHIELGGAPGDTIPPSVPTGLSAVATSATSVNLNWTTSTDNIGVAGYKVFRNGVQIGNSATTSYQDATCLPQTYYSYTVTALDAAGNESAQSTAAGVTTPSVPDNEAPSVPTGVSATALSATQVSVSWTASTDNVGVVGYKVFRNGVQVATRTTTSYSDSTCAPNTTYSYRVSAYDSAGNESAQSSAANVTTPSLPDTQAPTVPTSVVATAVSSTEVNVSWVVSVDNVGVAGYRIFRDGVQIATSTTIGYTDSTCSPATTYSYTLSAYDAAGNESAQSAPGVVTTPASTDIILDNAVASYVGAWQLGTSSVDKYGADYRFASTASTETMTATWTPTIDVSGYYTVYCWYPQGTNRSVMAPYTVVWDGGQQTISVNQTTGGGQWVPLVTNKRFLQGTGGYVKLGNGTGEAKVVLADAVRFVLQSDDVTAPSVPTGLAATAVSSTAVDLTWSASTDNVAVAGYKVFRDGVQIATSATASYSDSTCAPETSYSYRVSAYDEVGNESAQSSPAGVITPPVPDTTPPSVPANLSGSAFSETQVNLTWTASTDNRQVTGYKVFRGGVQIGSSATTGYSDLTCAPNTSYTYTVSAYDAAGNESANSAPVVVTTPDVPAPAIIIDNPNATYTGSWTTGTSSSDKYGADYRYATSAAGETATAIFRPTIANAGVYNVYVWYPQGSNRTASAPYTVYYNGGSVTTNVNQTTGGGQWVLIAAARPFQAGTAGYVKLGNGTGEASKVVMADAVMFEYAGVGPTTKDYAPTAITLTRGTLTSGSAANLVADDASYLVITAARNGGTTRYADWYSSVSIAEPRNSVTKLSITFNGKLSATRTQYLYLYNFTTGNWNQIDSRSVSTSDVTVSWETASPLNYISSTGQIRLRQYVTRSSSFTTSTDFTQFRIEYN